ncbi:MAG: flagellar biosynthesis anti-sigma factor FlgM [Treponema sp.]|nr:flagellar biosynthesis anti-sigma factor FlgM [Treponema sp.]MCI5519154.1 flagellar biosynthesis anti-sigma factor FlgM [Treponema sp.]MCI6892334.1 flagellar biosynthesis anti-sigma factor FlgM [Treponema sp.]MCI7565215.1 flagellar biosynthesis anti-sigma factor FlgM [Treponema sp.]
MMINSVNNVTQVNNVQNLRKSEGAAKVSRDADSISVSAEAKEMAEVYYMEKVANETPDVRADRVAEVKEKLKDPNYLNNAVINSAADKFLSALGL